MIAGLLVAVALLAFPFVVLGFAKLEDWAWKKWRKP